METVLELSCFGICFITSGCLYAMIAKTLIQKSRQNTRTRTLTIALIVLWVTWGLFVIPYMVFNACFRFLHHRGERKAPSDWSLYVDDAPFGSFHDEDYVEPWERNINKMIVFGDIILRALKHSYSFINSLLLIILLRPFQKPFRVIGSVVKQLCCLITVKRRRAAKA